MGCLDLDSEFGSEFGVLGSVNLFWVVFVFQFDPKVVLVGGKVLNNFFGSLLLLFAASSAVFLQSEWDSLCN